MTNWRCSAYISFIKIIISWDHHMYPRIASLYSENMLFYNVLESGSSLSPPTMIVCVLIRILFVYFQEKVSDIFFQNSYIALMTD